MKKNEDSTAAADGFPPIDGPQFLEDAKDFAKNHIAGHAEMVISSKTLKAALQKVKGIVPNKPTLPILHNIVFSASAHQLAIMATDLDVTLMQYIELSQPVKGTLVALIPFAWLSKVCGLYSDMPLLITQEGKKLIITAESDVFDHDGLEAFDMYPELPQIPRDNMLVVGEDVIYWLDKAIVTAGQEDVTRPTLSKVFIEIMGDGINIVSTNAHALFTHRFPADTVAQTEVMLSQKVIKAMAGFKETSIFWNDKFVAFESRDIKVIAVRPEGNYVNWRAVIPPFESNLSIRRNALAAALDKISIVNGNYCLFHLKLDPSAILITAENADFGQTASAEVPLYSKYTGEVETIRLSPRLLQDLLSQIPYEEVGVAIHDRTKAVLMASEEDEGYKGLIMPWGDA